MSLSSLMKWLDRGSPGGSRGAKFRRHSASRRRIQSAWRPRLESLEGRDMPSTLVLPQTDVPAFTATYPVNEGGQILMADGPVAGGNFLGTLDGAKRLKASYCVD